MSEDDGVAPLRDAALPPSGLSRGASQAKPAAANAMPWWAGDNEEFFAVGPYETRDEALGEAWGYFGDDRDIYLLQAEMAEWPAPDAASIIDMMIDNSDELFFDDGFTGMAGTKEAVAEAEAELNRLLADWMTRYRSIFPNPTAFGRVGEREKVSARVSDSDPEGENAGAPAEAVEGEASQSGGEAATPNLEGHP